MAEQTTQEQEAEIAAQAKTVLDNAVTALQALYDPMAQNIAFMESRVRTQLYATIQTSKGYAQAMDALSPPPVVEETPVNPPVE